MSRMSVTTAGAKSATLTEKVDKTPILAMSFSEGFAGNCGD